MTYHSSDIHIREYTENDKNTVLGLLRMNIPAYFAPKEEADFSNYLDTLIELYYIIECEGKVAGCGGINFKDQITVGVISWDVLHPDYQGKSLGTRLLKHRIDILSGISSVRKISVRTSQMAYRFYRKNGFVLKQIETDYWADGYDMYYMEYQPSEAPLAQPA